MKNIDIVIHEALTHGIFTTEQIDAFLQEGDLPLKTFAAWRQDGYIVRKGQKAALQTRLWKKRPPKKNKNGGAPEPQAADQEDKDEDFILVPAHLFTLEQVARIES